MKIQILAVASLILLSGCSIDKKENPQDIALKEFQEKKMIVDKLELEYKAAQEQSSKYYLSLQEAIIEMDDAKAQLYSIIN